MRRNLQALRIALVNKSHHLITTGLFKREPLLSGPFCRIIIRSAIDLAMREEVGWIVVPRIDGEPGSSSLSGARVAIPEDAAEWFELRFAIAGTAYALAFIDLWAVSVARKSAMPIEAAPPVVGDLVTTCLVRSGASVQSRECKAVRASTTQIAFGQLARS